MENKINIAELLKDCPIGMELDCSIFEDVTLYKIDTDIENEFPIRIKTKNDYFLDLTKYGTYANVEEAICVIFPKGKTTWEGFQRPFKVGDIVFYDNCVSIFKEWGDETLFRNYVKVDIDGRRPMLCDKTHSNGKGIKREARLATEDEKQELFDAIKANGYKWNTETKTLEKLTESKENIDDRIVMSDIYFNMEDYADEVELHLSNYEIEIRDGRTYAILKNQKIKTSEKSVKPIFRVGDIIQNKVDKWLSTRTIKSFTEGIGYFTTVNDWIRINEQDKWELVPNKFDINTLVPFESRVLVREDKTDVWRPTFYGFFHQHSKRFYTTSCGTWLMCIPYNERTMHLTGTTNDCNDFYKTWEK